MHERAVYNILIFPIKAPKVWIYLQYCLWSYFIIAHLFYHFSSRGSESVEYIRKLQSRCSTCLVDKQQKPLMQMCAPNPEASGLSFIKVGEDSCGYLLKLKCRSHTSHDLTVLCPNTTNRSLRLIIGKIWGKYRGGEEPLIYIIFSEMKQLFQKYI